MSDDMPTAMNVAPTTILLVDYGHNNFEARIKGHSSYGVGDTKADAIRQLALMDPGIFCVDDAVNTAYRDERFGEKVLKNPDKYNVIIDERRDPRLDE